jgi:tetratricopeptide (TPR) repeat protein
MSNTNRSAGMQWTRERAALLAVVCLLAGIAGGWSIRGSRTAAAMTVAKVSDAAFPAAKGAGGEAGQAAQGTDSAQLKDMADTQAAPLLDKLKSDPSNADLLSSVGNLYYDAHQYPAAVDYYARTLKARPTDAAVRTDMGTAFWYMGNADRALAEFDKALGYAPNNANTLFNRGLVRWKGKTDGAGAIGDWEKLLATNPNYEGKAQVEQMLAEVRKHVADGPGTKVN